MTPNWSLRGRIDLASVTHLAILPGNPADGTVVAVTPAGLNLSHDGGETWQAPARGLVGPLVRDLALSPHGATVGIVVAVMPGRLCVSVDRGQTWRASEIGPAVGPLALLAGGDLLLVSETDGGVWRSNIDCSSPRLVGRVSAPVTALTSSVVDDTVWGATTAGIATSVDGGERWRMLPATEGLTCQAIARCGPGAIVCGMESGGVIVLGHHAETTPAVHLAGEVVTAVAAAADGSSIFAGTANGVFSSIGGDFWAGPLGDGPVMSLACNQGGSTIWAGLVGTGCRVSTDHGRNWRPVTMPEGTVITDLASTGRQLSARTIEGLVAHSADDGCSWHAGPLPTTATVQALAPGPTPSQTLYATIDGLHAGDRELIAVPNLDSVRRVARAAGDDATVVVASATTLLASRDGLRSWTDLLLPLRSEEEIVDLVLDCAGAGGVLTIAAATRDAGGYCAVWIRAGELPWRTVIAPENPAIAVRLAAVPGPRGIFAAAGDSVYRPARVGTILYSREWVDHERPGEILHLAAARAGTDTVLAVSTTDMLAVSPDGGLSWTSVPGPGGPPVTALALHPTALGLVLVVAVLGGAVWTCPLDAMAPAVSRWSEPTNPH